MGSWPEQALAVCVAFLSCFLQTAFHSPNRPGSRSVASAPWEVRRDEQPLARECVHPAQSEAPSAPSAPSYVRERVGHSWAPTPGL